MTQQSDTAAQRRRTIATAGLFGAILIGVALAVFSGPGGKQVSPEPSAPAVKSAPTQPVATAPTKAKRERTKRTKKPEPPAEEEAPEVLWADPPGWKRMPRSGMRYASYEIPAAKGESLGGELNIFILRGDVEPNIQRWIAEFSKFDLKTVVRKKRTVNGMPQHIVEIPKGHFDGGMGDTKASDNYGLLGAIVVAPSGAEYFFKLTAPSKLVKAARKPFYAMLDSLYPVKSAAKPADPAPAAAPGATPAAAAPAAPAPAAPAPAPAAAPAPTAPAPAGAEGAPQP
ncbi:MAG: hypothetical protein RL685_343 [Pseudomonadota bacterium]|jgi:hypothetical protein